MLKETEILSKEGTARGDPFSMAIYGTGVLPLLNMLIDILINNYKVQVHFLAYADDFSAEGCLEDIRIWGNVRNETGPKFRYYPEPAKTKLDVKPCKANMLMIFSLEPKSK